MFNCEGSALYQYIDSFELADTPITKGYTSTSNYFCLRLRYVFDGENKVIQKMIKKSKPEETLKVTFSRFLEQGKDILNIVVTNLQDTELDSEQFTLFCFC